MATQIGELFLQLRLDTDSYRQSLQTARVAAEQTGRQIEQSLNFSKQKLHLEVTTNDRPLTELNKHIELKRTHVKDVQRFLDSNPITPKVDLSNLKTAQTQIVAFRKDLQELNTDLAKVKASLNQSFKLNIDDSDLITIEKRLEKIKTQHIKVNASFTEPKEKSTKPKEQVIKVRQDTSLIGGLKTGFIEGIGQSFALRVGSGMVQGVEKNLGVNLKKIGDAFGIRYSQVARNISENFVQAIGLSDGSKALTSEFNSVLLKWEALTEKSATAIGATLKQAITGNFAQAKQEVISFSKDIAALGIDSSFAPVRIRKREVAKGAAKEVVNRQGEINVDRNSAIENAQSITIATGGLNFSPGGKENTNFVRDLLKPVLPNSYIVGVANPATNSAEGFATEFNSFTKKLFSTLGREVGDLDVRNLGKLAEMAIVKGINPDAITMAATAYAYKQAYPEKGINLVGTSGGGHVAADAVYLLEQLGIDTKGLGITTPFAGLANITNPKQFRAQIGTADPIYQRMFGGGIFKPGNVQDTYPGVGLGHLLPKFLAEESVQKDIQAFLGDRIGAVNPDVTGKKGYLNMLGYYTKKASDSGNIRDAIAQSQGMSGESWFYKPDESFTRLQDLQGYIGALRDVSQKAKGSVKTEAEQYIQFLEEFYTELEKHFATDRQYLPDLSKAQKYYPEAIKSVTPDRLPYTERSMNAAMQDYRYRGKTQSELGNFRRSISVMRGESVDGYSYFKKEAGSQNQIAGLSNYLNELAANASESQSEIVRSQKQFVSDLSKLIQQYHEVGLEPNAWEIDAIEQQLNQLESVLKQPFTPKLEVDQIEIAKVKIEKATSEIALKTKSVFRRLANATSNAANAGGLALLNNKIASIEAFQDESGISPQVARFSDLSLRGYGAIAQQDTGKVLEFLRNTVGKGYGALKGVENFTLNALPFGQTAKTGLQQIALPALAFNMATHALPGGSAIASGATEAVGHALQLPLSNIGEAVIVAVNHSMGEAIAQVPLIGHKLAPALQAGITNLIEGAVQNIASGAASVAAPVVGGQAMLAPVKAAGSLVVGDQSEIVAATQQQMKILKAGINQAKQLQSARPERSQLFAAGIEQDIKRIQSQINEGVASLAPIQRTGTIEGNQLAQLKGQIAQQERKLSQLVKGLRQMVARPQEMMRSSIQGEIIDAEIIDIPALKPVNSIALPSSKDLVQEAEKNAIVQLKRLRQIFSEQTKLAQSNTPESVEVARELQNAIASARSEVDAVMSAIGKNASSSLKQAAKQARAQITRTETTANKVNPSLEGVSIGSNITSGLNTGLTQGLSGVKAASERLANAVISATEDELEIRSPSRVFVRIGQMVVEGLENGLNAIGRIQMGSQLNPVVQEVKDILNGLAPEATKVAGLIQKAYSMLPGPVRAVVAAFLGFQALSFVVPFLVDFGRQSVQTAIEVEALERSLSFTEGGIDQGIAKLKEINAEANLLGVNAMKAAEGYTRIASAAKDTPLEGFASEQFYKGLQTAAIAGNANAQRQELVNLAGAQMIQKGTLSQEELRQQLAENLPGVNSSAILARSMNVDVPKLNKMIESGLVTSDVLPNFGQQLQAELAIPAEEASKSAQASFNRLENSITQLQTTAGKGILPVQALGAEAIAQTLNAVNNNASTLMASVSALSIMLGVTLVKALYAVVSQFVQLPKLSVLAANAFRTMSTSIGTAAASIGLFALKFTLLTGAIMAASEAMSVFGDQSGQLRTSSDTAKKSLDALQEKLRGKTDVTEGDVLSSDNKKRDAAYSKAIQNEKNPFMSGYMKILQATSFLDNLNAGRWFQQFKQGKTEKDQQRSIADLQNLTPTALQESRSLRNSPGMSRLRQINQQLEDNQLKQRALRSTNPNDIQGLNALKAQEEAIRKASESLIEKKATAQKSTSVFIESLKSQIEELDKDPKFVKEVDRLKQLLKEAEQEQQDFNRTFDSSASRLERFGKAWDTTIARMKDASTELRNQETIANIDINAAQATGNLTPGQAQSARTGASQERLRLDTAQTKAKITQLEVELSKLDAQKVLGQYNLSNAGQQELTDRANKANEGSRERKVFESAAQLKELQSQALQMDAELSSSIVQVSEELYGANKAILDYYRGIERQIEDINAAVKTQSLEIKSLNLRSRIDEALTGVRKTFVSDLTNAIVEWLDVTNQKGRNLQNAINVQTNALRRLQDATLQGQDLQRGLPTGATDIDSGGAFASGLFTGPAGSIGAGTEYHIDTKFHRDMSESTRIGIMDGLAQFYAQQGRSIEFSNAGVGGERWNLNDPNRGRLLRRAQQAHSHSQYSDWDSIDYYIPKSNETRSGNSVVGAQIALPSIPGGRVEYATGGNYGNHALIYDAQGRLIMKTGHGDDRRQLPVNRGFNLQQQSVARDRIQPASEYRVNENAGKGGPGSSSLFVRNTPQAIQTPSRLSSVGGFDANRINRSVQILLQQGLSPLAASYLTGSFMQESGLRTDADDGTHRGIMQWEKGVRDRGLPSDFDGQVRFAVSEGMQDSPHHIKTLRDRSATPQQVEAAIRGLTRWATGAEKSRFQYGREIFKQMGNSTSGGAISASSPDVDLSILNNLGAAGTQESQSATQFANAQNRALDTQTNRAVAEARLKLSRDIAENSKEARSTFEAVQDQMRSIGFDTPEKSARFKAIDITRSARDQSEQIKLKIEDLNDALKELDINERIVLDGIKNNSIGREQATPILQSIKSSRESTKKTIATYEETAKLIKQTEQAQINDNAAKLALEIAKRDREFVSRLSAINTESIQLEAERLRTQGDPRGFIQFQSRSQTENQINSFEQEKNAIEEFARSSGLADEKTRQLLDALEQLSQLKLDNIANEAKKLNRALDITRQEQIFESINKIGDAEIEGFRIIGMDRFARDIERERALAQERFSLAAEMERINEAVANGRLDRTTADTIASNVDKAFQKRIDNIKRQYSVLSEIIAQNKGSFQEFFTGLINGTESFGSAFSKLVQSIGNNLASMASQFLTEELMGIFTGKNRKANEADAKELYGGISPAYIYNDRGRDMEILEGGQKFVGLSEQAGQIIVEAGLRFANAIAQSSIGIEQDTISNLINREFGLANLDTFSTPRFLGAEQYGIGNGSFSGEVGATPEREMRFTKILSSKALSSIVQPDYSGLFESAESASFTIADGARIASDLLTNAGTGTADNLIGTLSKGLPGIAGNIAGLIGSIFGGKKSGGIGGILNSVLGIAGTLFGGGGGIPDITKPILNFADGGLVDDRAVLGGKLFQGRDSISQAVRREGANDAIVAVLNRRERVLSPSETQIFYAMQLDKIVEGRHIPNFNRGGMAGGQTAMRFSGGQAINITVPVTVSDGSNVDPQKLGESIRGAVQSEIARQQRPGGQLY